MNDLALRRAIAVIESDSESFSVLALKSGLSPHSDFVGVDLSGLDLRGEDLREFDFTRAKFDGAEVGGARFNSTVTPEQLANAFWQSLLPPPERIERAALFFDLDGVLSPLEAHPSLTVENPSMTSALASVAGRFEGRVAIISGRTIAEVDRVLGGVITSVAGLQGLEYRLPDGALTRAAPPAVLQEALEAFEGFARTRPGMIVEDLGVAVSLHFRGAPKEAGAARALANELGLRTGLSLREGEWFSQLRPGNLDRGAMIRTFMDLAPFAGARPLYLGDDFADEAGFEAASALGGYGILVGPVHASSARYGLRDQSAVLEWLRSLTAR